MFKSLRLAAAASAFVLAGLSLPAHAIAPGIGPVLFIGATTGAGPVLALGQEALNSIGWSCSDAKAKAEEAMKTADWSKAKRVNVTLEDDLLSPGWLRIQAGVPYVMVIKNGDGDSGTFRAPDFFANVGNENGGVMGWMRVGAEETREVRVFAIEKGVYDMDMGLFTQAWGVFGKIEVY